MVSSLSTELQKMPTKNHNKNPQTTKKSAVTKVLRALRIVTLTLLSSALGSSSCFIRLASSKSCCKESSIEDADVNDVDDPAAVDDGCAVDDAVELPPLLLVVETD